MSYTVSVEYLRLLLLFSILGSKQTAGLGLPASSLISCSTFTLLVILRSNGESVFPEDAGVGVERENVSSLIKLSKSPFVNSSSASSLSDVSSCSVRLRFLATFVFVGFELFFVAEISFLSFDTEDTVREHSEKRY